MHSLDRRRFLAALAAASAASAQPNPEPASPSLASLSLAEASTRIRARSVTPTQLVEACLARVDTYNPKLNAFITVTRAQALAQAKLLEAELASGRSRGPLHGIPIALKDNIDTAGIRTTAASAVFDDRVPTQDAEVARRLAAAGAILIGKTNLHEFAMGGTNATSYFGPVRNPWALDRNPGGSSGGSGAAVAAQLCFGALGTDTGGSIRTPASWCGIVGFKPTYGLVSIRGIIPLTLTLDHCGPMTRTVEDAALMLDAMAGYDKLDIASIEAPGAAGYAAAARQPVSGLRIGIPRSPFFDHLEDGVAKAMDEAIRVIGKLTKSTVECTLPSTREISLRGESYAYHEQLFAASSARYMIPTRRSLQSGPNLKAAEYIQARWKLDLLRRTINDSFQNVDLVILPTRRRSPRTVDASIKREETEKMRNPELENTGQFNYYGIPAISVPCGFTASRLPIGLMIAGPRLADGRVLALARAFEQATEWHQQTPPLTPATVVPPLAPPTEG